MNNSLFFKRALNTRGQIILSRIEFGLGLIFGFSVFIYAIVRGHRFAIQLPATFRTTASPQKVSVEFLNEMFPSQIPPPTYEFPAVTICPEIGELAGIISCYAFKTASGDKEACDETGTYSRMINFIGLDRECVTVNDLPGKTLIASHEGDQLTITTSISGSIKGSPSGVFVIAHPHNGRDKIPEMTFDNFFGAGVGTASQIISK